MAERPRSRVRRAGSRWRLLVHEWSGGLAGYGTAHDLRNYSREPIRPLIFSEAEWVDYRAKVLADRAEAVAKGWAKDHILQRTEFDELVVGNWLHIEQMDTGFWWMNVGGVTLHVRADRDGRPTHVMVHGPGDYDDPVEGVTYELCWHADSRDPENDGANGRDHG